MLRYLIHLFTSPSAYLHNWRAFATNQAGHGAVGIVLASIISWHALVVYAAWETAQYFWNNRVLFWLGDEPVRQHRATVSDCIYDWCFVATGVLAVMYDAWPLIGLQVALIGAGVAERRKW